MIPPIQAQWALICSAAEVLIEANRVGKELKTASTTVPALVKAYADGDEPWCLLDTHHRHMESRKYNFEFAASDQHHGLEKLITKAGAISYTEVGFRTGEAVHHLFPESQASNQGAAPAAGDFREAGEAAPG